MRLLFLVLLSITALSEEAIISDLKKAEISQAIQQSSKYKKCESENEREKEKSNYFDLVKDCFFGDNPDELEKADLEIIKKSFGLKSYRVTEDKDRKEFSTFLKQRLHVALYGEEFKADKIETFHKKKEVDHKDFYELYKTQLSKNVFMDLTNYCLNHIRDKDGKFPDLTNPIGAMTFDDFKSRFKEVSQKEDSDSLMKHINQAAENKILKLNKQLKDKSEIKHAHYLSYLIKNEFSRGPDKVSQIHKSCISLTRTTCGFWVEREKDKANQSKYDGYIDGTACIYQNKLKAHARNMEQVDKTIKELNDGGSSKDGFVVKNKEFYDRENKKDGINSLTTISTKEIKKGLKQNQALKDLQAKCASASQNNGQIDPKCEELISKSYDDYNNQKNDLLINSEAQKNYINSTFSKVEENEDDFKKFLKEQGHFEILNKLSSKDSPITLSEAKDELITVLDAQKNMAINSLKNRFNAKVLKGSDTEKRASQNNEAEILAQDNKSLFSDIESDLSQKQQRLINVFEYANVVNSFIETCEGSLKKAKGSKKVECPESDKGYNIMGLKKELSGSKDEGDESYFVTQDYSQYTKEDSKKIVQANAVDIEGLVAPKADENNSDTQDP